MVKFHELVLLPLYVQTVDSEESLRELVYEQWLYADLKDVVSQGCIPVCVARQQKGQVRGRFVVQVSTPSDFGFQNKFGTSLFDVA